MALPPTTVTISSDDALTLLKQQAVTEVTDRAVADIKSKFWQAALITVVFGGLGGWALISSTARETVKELNHGEIARVLSDKDSFRAGVLSQLILRLSARVVPGNVVDCNVNGAKWAEGVGSTATCGPNEIRVGGGCRFTCLGSDHTVSVPDGTHNWQCRHIVYPNNETTKNPTVDQLVALGWTNNINAKPGPRNFQAHAVCLTIKN